MRTPSERVKYPNRTKYFSVHSGLLDAKAEADRVEKERLKRLAEYSQREHSVDVAYYMDTVSLHFRVTPIEDFKKEFNL